MHRYYDKQLAARAVEAEIKFSSLGGKRATNTKELKTLLIEFDSRRKEVEEVGTKRLTVEHMKAVLSCILDDDTRRYTVKSQQGTYEELRK